MAWNIYTNENLLKLAPVAVAHIDTDPRKQVLTNIVGKI